MRPKHWVKSGFCLAALIFSGQASELSSWLQMVPLLVGFCFLSSGGYLINDAINMDEDACHPRKRLRPLAAGRLKKNSVVTEAICMALLGLGLLFWVYGGSRLSNIRGY